MLDKNDAKHAWEMLHPSDTEKEWSAYWKSNKELIESGEWCLYEDGRWNVKFCILPDGACFICEDDNTPVTWNIVSDTKENSRTKDTKEQYVLA